MARGVTYEPIPRSAKRLLAGVTLAWWDALLAGGSAPSSQAACARARVPHPGDLVVEMSTLATLCMRDPDLLDDRWDGQFAPFLRSEIRHHDEEDEEDEGATWTWSEDVHVVGNPDGSEFTWSNATLLAVPAAPGG